MYEWLLKVSVGPSFSFFNFQFSVFSVWLGLETKTIWFTLGKDSLGSIIPFHEMIDGFENLTFPMFILLRSFSSHYTTGYSSCIDGPGAASNVVLWALHQHGDVRSCHCKQGPHLPAWLKGLLVYNLIVWPLVFRLPDFAVMPLGSQLAAVFFCQCCLTKKK